MRNIKEYFGYMLGALFFQEIAYESYNLYAVILATYCCVMMFISYVHYVKSPLTEQIILLEGK